MKIGYARVSTKDQNFDLQIQALQKAGCELIYKEKRSAIKERPELERMMAYLRSGDVVVVWKLDRLARSLQHILFLIDEFKKKNIRIISLSDNVDTDTPTGKFFLSITGAFAELERNLIVERTQAGLQAAKERGVKLGRKKGISEERKVVLEAACTLYKDGEMTTPDICASLGISSATLYRYLELYEIPKKNNPGRRKKITDFVPPRTK